MYRILSYILGISSVLGYSAGYDSCINVPNHGTWANGCNSTFCANSPYTIQVMNNGAIVNSYVPTTKYTISITSPMNFRGFTLISGLGSDIATFTTVAALQQGSGTLTLGTDTHVRQMTGCTNGLTQTSATNVKQVSASWTAPHAGAGFVTFKAIIVVTQNGNNFVSHRILSEASSNSTFTGTISPTRTVSVSRSITVSLSPSRSITVSLSPSHSLSVSPSHSLTVSPVPMLSSTLSPTLIPTSVLSPSLVPSSSLSESVSSSPSVSSLASVSSLPSVSPSPSVSPTESVYPSSSSVALPSPTESVYPSPSESVYPSSSSVALASATSSPSSTYNGTQYLRTTNTAGVNTEGVTAGTVIAIGAAVAIIVGSTIAFKNKNKKRAVSSRKMEIADYVTQNPIESLPVTVSRFSLTTKTKKEFSPMQSIA